MTEIRAVLLINALGETILHPIRGIAVLHNSSDMIQHDLTVAGPRVSLGQHKFLESIG